MYGLGKRRDKREREVTNLHAQVKRVIGGKRCLVGKRNLKFQSDKYGVSWVF